MLLLPRPGTAPSPSCKCDVGITGGTTAWLEWVCIDVIVLAGGKQARISRSKPETWQILLRFRFVWLVSCFMPLIFCFGFSFYRSHREEPVVWIPRTKTRHQAPGITAIIQTVPWTYSDMHLHYLPVSALDILNTNTKYVHNIDTISQ